MGRILFAISLMLAGLVQASLLPSADLIAILPNFALVMLLIWSASHGVEEGLLWAFGLGIWMDLLTLDPLGSHALQYFIVAAIGGAVRGRFFRSGAILPVAAVVAATLGAGVAGMVMDLFRGLDISLIGSARLILMAALLNALVVPVAYFLILMYERWAPRRVSKKAHTRTRPQG